MVGTFTSPPPHQPPPPLGGVSGVEGGPGGGVIQSQSEMILCRRAGGNLIPQSQSFFEMPKSMTQEFTTFVPASLEGFQGGGKKQANATRSADLLLPVKYARIPNNKEVSVGLSAWYFTAVPVVHPRVLGEVQCL